jgi:NAD-dependent dihydropyrimidine dehydrogenase PreA subunit
LAQDPHASPISEDLVHDLRSNSAEEIIEKFVAGDGVSGRRSDVESGKPGADTRGWYPVLDYDRCNHCAQCLSFCLFEVFARNDDGTITVERPENCKDNCPACARICPEVAIVFPKTSDTPINGDEIKDEMMEREKARIALEQSGAADFREALKKRRKGSLLKPEARERLERKPTDDDQGLSEPSP